MRLYNTYNPQHFVDLKEACLKSLAPDRGLYMPAYIPVLPPSFFENIENFTFQELSFEIAYSLIGDYIPKDQLSAIIDRSISFPAPVVMHDDNIGTLELFHGPSLAFKDFGARFMAELISYFMKEEGKKLTILVATSGDTGGAVAAGFYNTPHIEVFILYPKGKVSHLQELQLTTHGGNISAFEIDGTFDDCQSLVKEAFLDKELNQQYNLSSANSINIARLIPQMFYYFEAYRQVKSYGRKVVVAVPSGNFGNLTAGLIAKKMGLPIDHFIAATNINKIVPTYLETGVYEPKPSVLTISNAMDVGSPSNFVRMQSLYNGDLEAMRKDVSGHFDTDIETKAAISEIYNTYGYIADPHGAIGYDALQGFLKNNNDYIGLYLETAHPSKFIDVYDESLKSKIQVPDRLSCLTDKEKKVKSLPSDFESFKAKLMALSV